MLNLTILTWLRFFVWMVIGVLVYFTYGRRHSLLGIRSATETPLPVDGADPKATSS